MISSDGAAWKTTGFSVSTGKLEMPKTELWMSARAPITLVPCSSSMKTVHMPSPAQEVTWSMPTVPSMASSTRRQTPSSTSSGAAPR